MSGQTIAVGYIRVSTEEQAREGVSLDAQREKIVAYCALHGQRLQQTYADEGISGKRADNRPGLQEALDRTCKLKDGVLVVYIVSEIERRVLSLNSQIAEEPNLGKPFRIGHSFVTPALAFSISDPREWFRQVVETEIGPLLQEYWFDSPSTAGKAISQLIEGL